MTVDEMDLVSQLKDVPPLRPEAYEHARAMLGTAMAESRAARVPDVFVAAPVRRERFSWMRNFHVGILGKVGIGAIGAVAAAVAIVSVASPAPRSAVPAGAAAGSASQAPAVGSRLVSLADDITASGGARQGNASLVIRTQTVDGRKPYVTYNLYTDGGAVYVTDTKSALPRAIAHHDNLADPVDSREVAAARNAATGDLVQAREQMVNATPNPWGLGLDPAAAQKAWNEAQAKAQQILREKGVTTAPRPRPTGKALQDGIDNSLWTNSVDALARGAENPEVRAGVLRLLSTIPDVTVADSTTAGQPTLTLTARPALFGGSSQEVLTIDAKNGLPVSSVVTPSGQKPAYGSPVPPATETYRSSRVTLADVEAGKF